MRHALAREIMSSPVITASPDMSFKDIVAIMLEHGISGLPIVDEGGRLVGMVSEADLLLKEEEPRAQPGLIPWHGSSLRLERIRDRHRKAEGMTAGTLMTENVVSATESATIHHLAHLMLVHDINRIPIVRDGRVVGIVTRADILKVFTRGDEALLKVVQQTLAQDLWIDPKALSITCLNGVITLSGQAERHSDRDIIIRWVKAIDGVVGVNADHLEFRVDDLALGRVIG